MHVAACNGYLQVLEFLLCHGAIISAVDNDGWQPLHCAVCWGQVAHLSLCGQVVHPLDRCLTFHCLGTGGSRITAVGQVAHLSLCGQVAHPLDRYRDA